MYLAILRYQVPPEEIQLYREAHLAFLDDGYAAGILIASGKMISARGGIILSSCARLGDFEQFMRQDPFIKNKLASYEIIAFEPSKFHPDFEKFIREPEREEIELLPYTPQWKEVFSREAEVLRRILGSNVDAVHHIGSTSIPGIVAKPIVDILCVVKDIEAVDQVNREMEASGYEVKGEYGIAGRRFFVKRNKGKRIFNVHMFQKGHQDIDRHLIFREYLKAHPEEAAQYSDLKKQLVKNSSTDIEKYCWGKDEFVKDLQEKALRWHEELEKKN
jgi:GrpB-like predicted nucleotidyltransferase (UPF0157 family)/uncharacterized protein YciI